MADRTTQGLAGNNRDVGLRSQAELRTRRGEAARIARARKLIFEVQRIIVHYLGWNPNAEQSLDKLGRLIRIFIIVFLVVCVWVMEMATFE